MENIIKSFLDLSGDVASTQVADVYLPLVSLGSVGDTAAVAIINNNSYKYEKSEPLPNAKEVIYDLPCEDTFDITNLAQVRSLNLEIIANTNYKGKFNTLKRRMKARKNILNDIKKLGWAKNNIQKEKLDSLILRWTNTETILLTPNYHPDKITLITNSVYNQQKNEEGLDLNSFSGEKYKNMFLVINEFYDAYEELLLIDKKYKEETEEILRFDTIYNSTEVINLLNQIPYVFFTAAEIKALNMQETGDLRNKTVAGLEDKTLGFPVGSPKNDGFAGLGQHGRDAIKDAKKWAKGKQIYSLENVEFPNLSIRESILMTIAYLGWIVEFKICPNLDGIPLDCLELKKMIFASYNAGINHTIYAIKKLFENEDRNITWNKVYNFLSKSGRLSAKKLNEMHKYAKEIPERLTHTS